MVQRNYELNGGKKGPKAVFSRFVISCVVLLLIHSVQR